MSKTSKTTTIIKSNVNNPPRRKRSKKNKSSKEVSVPLAKARTMETKQQNVFKTPMREEFLSSLPGTTLPLAIHQTIVMNPGNPAFSKWGNNIAACFESYHFDFLEIEYISRCSASTEGYVCISPDCNPHDPAPNTEQELYANEKAKSDSPWKSFKVTFNKEMLSKRKTYFCRKNGDIPNGADKDLYDVGNLYLVSGGQLAGGFIGQIWIRWKATFYTPEANFITQAPTIMGSSISNVSATAPLGGMTAATVSSVANPLSSIVNDGTGSVLTFAKDFHGFLTMTGAGTGLTGNPSITSLFGATVNEIEDAVNQNFQLVNAAGTGMALNSLITAKLGDVIRLVGGTGGTYSTGRLSLMSCAL